MTIWFTSDTHFNHARIIELSNRPFKADKKRSAIQVMNDALVERWNSLISPGDKVYHLGDFGLGQMDDTLTIIGRLNGFKTLVTGNHDRNFRGGRRSASLDPWEWDDVYRDSGFDDVVQNIALSGFVDQEPVMLSHFPYTGDHFDGDRFEEYRAHDSGLPIVHGHTHSDKAISYSARGTLQIHAGVDTWNYYPVSYDQITLIIRSLRPRH